MISATASSQQRSVGMFQPIVPVRFAGVLARPALVRSRGVTHPVRGFESTAFRMAADTLIWIGRMGYESKNAPGDPRHPRSVLLDADPGDALLAIEPGAFYSDDAPAQILAGQDLQASDAAITAARAILRISSESTPSGFGCLLVGRSPPFPLSHRVEAAHALAHACATRDPNALLRYSLPLLGAGPGLTPAGDDFVGGALFALGAMRDGAHWHHAVQSIIEHAPQRTHMVSATLLGDLARGHSYAALHAFFDSISRGDTARAIRHATALTAIGSSSGWDMLCGVVAALCGKLDIRPPVPL